MTHFKKIAIVGVGLIGGSLGMALKRKFKDIEIIGISSQKTLDTALPMGIIDRGFERSKLKEGIEIILFR